MTSDGTWSYSWKNGRELASMSKSGTTWSFTYDADGLRTQRTNGSTTYSYVYNGSQLSYMGVGSDHFYFSYDASGTPVSVKYNNTTYYYATNLQGDVTAILNSSGTAVVTYTYDAWGNVTATANSTYATLAERNPLKYRGYVHDQETGLYYLQSRYYNPAIGRFINADAFAATGQGVLGNNMFAYCNNNPVINYDPGGQALVASIKDEHDPTLGMFVGLTGGGGGGAAYAASIRPESVRELVNNVSQAIDEAWAYVANKDEQVVLDAEHFAFYKGTLVIRHSSSFLTSWAMCGVIFLNRNGSDANDLKHEKGHIIQEKFLGSENYLITVFAPSAAYNLASRGNNTLNNNYYNMPWECSADLLGGAARSHAKGSKLISILYLLLSGGRR